MSKSRTRGASVSAALQQGCRVVLLGALSGFVCVAARFVFTGLQWCFTGKAGLLPHAAAALHPWARALVPVVGALLAAAVLALRDRLSTAAEPFTDYVEAVRERDGRIPLVPNLWRIASAAFSIGSGAAVGREGAMIQFATALTSWTGRLRPARSFSLSRQVACGVAAAVAAVYKAPIAAVFFASEIVLESVSLRDYPLLLLASFTGWLVSRSLPGPDRLFPAPAMPAHPSPEWLYLPALAALLGLLGPAYQALIRAAHGLRRFPVSLLWGGAAVGLMSLAEPAVWGNGDVALLRLIGAAPAVHAVLLTLALRTLATSVCVGVGTVGGVFTPTLFTGAALGFIAAGTMHASAPVLFVMVGLAALLSAVSHAPLMATFMAVELTGAWPLFPLLLVCNLVAYGVARRLSSRSLYGIATTRPGQVSEPVRSSTAVRP